MKVKKINFSDKAVCRISNKFLSIEILEFDGRVLQIIDNKHGYKFLSERIFSLAARSQYPYGITTWVKTGSIRDGAAGVLSENAIGYDVAISQPLKIEKGRNSLCVRCVIEKNGICFEKKYEIEEDSSCFTYTSRVINNAPETKNLQLEHFFVWNSDIHREKISFVVPRENGLDELSFPPYDELDCHAVNPAENWAAYVNRYNESAVIFTFSGILYISRYIAGDNGQCAGYSPEIILDRNGEIVNIHRFYVLANINTHMDKHKEIEPIRERICNTLNKKVFVHSEKTIEEKIRNLVFLPEKFIRKQGNFVIDEDTSIEGRTINEINIFLKQLTYEYGIKIARQGIRKVRILTDTNEFQHYSITITPNEILIRGTNQSVQYGLQMLLDLCIKSGTKLILPCCEIEDRPEIPLRGMLMFPAGKRWDKLVEKFAIAVLTRLRFNMFMIYLEPQGIIPEKPLPGIQPRKDAIEVHRLRALSESLLGMHIKLLLYCSTKHIICPWCQKEETRLMCQFLEMVIEKLKPDFINIGYDEMGRFFSGCRCTPDRKNHEAFVKSITYFHDFLKKKGTRASIWCDMLFRRPGDPLGWLDDPEWALNNLPKDVILNDYEYMPDVEDYRRIEKWKKSGFDVLCTPWAMEENILNWANSAKRYGAIGILGSSWTEGPSQKKLGFIEGLVWTGILSWRSSNVEIEKVKPLVKNIAYKIAERKWEKQL
ncbi:MAG: hypothetical protein NC913_00975 [Candidatus Omnitrophica bacterium]|nr:hypothetical protein [Candidatus Omnitrophota bacterium]